MNPTDQSLPVHQQLNHLRESAGLSYEQLSERANMDVSQVHRIIKGMRTPTRDNILCLSIGLTCDVETTNALLTSARHLPLMNKRS